MIPRHNYVIAPPGTIDAIDRWLDGEVAAEYQQQPLAQDWARTSKVIEELGEAIADLITLTGQNPRKSQTHNADPFLGEMGDVVITAILCIQHFTKDESATIMFLRQAMQKAYGRAVEAGYEKDVN